MCNVGHASVGLLLDLELKKQQTFPETLSFEPGRQISWGCLTTSALQSQGSECFLKAFLNILIQLARCRPSDKQPLDCLTSSNEGPGESQRRKEKTTRKLDIKRILISSSLKWCGTERNATLLHFDQVDLAILVCSTSWRPNI